MGISQLGTSSGSRFVLKQNTAGQTPLRTSSFTIPASTSYTAWQQVTASLAAESYVTLVTISEATNGSSSLNADMPVFVDVGIGASGAEITLATVSSPMFNTVTNQFLAGNIPLTPPLRIAAGSRIAVRAAKALNGSGNPLNGVYIDLAVVPYANVEGN